MLRELKTNADFDSSRTTLVDIPRILNRSIIWSCSGYGWIFYDVQFMEEYFTDSKKVRKLRITSFNKNLIMINAPPWINQGLVDGKANLWRQNGWTKLNSHTSISETC